MDSAGAEPRGDLVWFAVSALLIAFAVFCGVQSLYNVTEGVLPGTLAFLVGVAIFARIVMLRLDQPEILAVARRSRRLLRGRNSPPRGFKPHQSLRTTSHRRASSGARRVIALRAF